MSDDKNFLKNEFIVPSQGTDEQKRQTLRDAIQDKQQQAEIDAMLAHRDKQLKREKEKQAHEQKREVDKRIAEKVGLKAEKHLKPKWVAGITPEQQRAYIQKTVAAEMRQSQNANLAKIRNNLNRNIDREINKALSPTPQKKELGVSATAVRAKKRIVSKKHQFQKNSDDVGLAKRQARSLSLKS